MATVVANGNVGGVARGQVEVETTLLTQGGGSGWEDSPPADTPTTTWPWNHADDNRKYHRLDILRIGPTADRVRYQRSAFPVPAFAFVNTVTAGTDKEPRAIRDALGLIWLVLTRSGNVLATTSRTYGADMEDPATLFVPGSHPTVAEDKGSKLVVQAAYQSGKIVAALNWRGLNTGEVVTFKNTAGANLAVADDSFHLANWLGTWYMAVRLSGSGSVSLMRSRDQCRSWEPLYTVLPGGRRPTIGIGRRGLIAALARVSGHMNAVLYWPGSSGPGAPFTLLDQSGVTINVEDDSFNVVWSKDGAAGWVGTWVVAGETAASDWQGKDDLTSFVRL